MHDIFAIGAAHIDKRAFLKAPHQIHTSNPARVFEEVGGGTFNAARAIKSFGLSVSLLSARGGDLAANIIETAIRESGIDDKSSVYLDRTSPSYTAIIDFDGELVTGFADMDLYECAIERAFNRSHIIASLTSSKALLVDANISSTTLQRIAQLADKKPIFAMAISASKVERLRPIFENLHILFMNKYEANALLGIDPSDPMEMINALRQQGLNRAVITDGPNALWAFEKDQIIEFMPPLPTQIIDVTGAGDAFAGAVIAQIMRGISFKDAIETGIAVASFVIGQKGCAPKIYLDLIKNIDDEKPNNG